ncbi:MAG TPA: type II toxin-antitoxin system RelE/ParE family toxin, partial [Acidisarcina sp.]
MKVIWSPSAAADLEAIGDFVSKDKPDAALKLVRTLFAGIESLNVMPHRGRPGRIEGTRELVIAPY